MLHRSSHSLIWGESEAEVYNSEELRKATDNNKDQIETRTKKGVVQNECCEGGARRSEKRGTDDARLPMTKRGRKLENV